MRTKAVVSGLITILLLVSLAVGCGRAPLPEAPELDFAVELEALEPIIPNLGEIDVGYVEPPLDLLGTIEIETDVSPSLASFDLSLPSPE